MHQQGIPVDKPLGDEAAREARTAVRDDRLALPGLQLRDFPGQVTARHMGLRPALGTAVADLAGGEPAFARASRSAADGFPL